MCSAAGELDNAGGRGGTVGVSSSSTARLSVGRREGARCWRRRLLVHWLVGPLDRSFAGPSVRPLNWLLAGPSTASALFVGGSVRLSVPGKYECT